MMTFPKARLIVSLCLFLGWIGFLGYLVYERSSIILSHPQFAVARAIVIADVKDGDAKVVVQEIPYCADEADRARLKDLVLPELLSCGKGQGKTGPGVYIIPLIQRDGVWQVAPVLTPGYPRAISHA